jgi:hypothetical protein
MFVFQDITLHHHELHLRKAASGNLHCLRYLRGGDTQATSSLLRGTCKWRTDSKMAATKCLAGYWPLRLRVTDFWQWRLNSLECTDGLLFLRRWNFEVKGVSFLSSMFTDTDGYSLWNVVTFPGISFTRLCMRTEVSAPCIWTILRRQMLQCSDAYSSLAFVRKRPHSTAVSVLLPVHAYRDMRCWGCCIFPENRLTVGGQVVSLARQPSIDLRNIPGTTTLSWSWS